MKEPSRYRRLPQLIALAAAGGLLTACGNLTVSGQLDPPGQAGTDAGLPTGGTDEYTGPETHELDTSIRVVNLYIPAGETDGQEIEVWYGSPEYGGEILATVGYGEVSDFFAPLGTEPESGSEEPGTTDWIIGFYRSGATTDDEQLISQGGSVSPGEKVTMIAMPPDPDGSGATLQSYLDNPGSEPQNSEDFFYDVPDGKGMVLLSAAPIQYLRDDVNEGNPTYIASDAAGSCLPSYDTISGELDDYSDGSYSLIGGTYPISYVFDLDTEVAVHRVGDNQFPADACAGDVALGPFGPELGEGDRAYALIYGPSLDQLDLLVVPVA